jgi:hypothetical protein
LPLRGRHGIIVAGRVLKYAYLDIFCNTRL